MARPAISNDLKRTINFSIRLTGEEQQKLKAAAELCSLSPGALIRHKVFRGKFPQAKTARLELKTYVELKKIGVNLNQLTKLAHTGRIDINLIKILMQLLRQQEVIIAQILFHDSQSKDK